MSKPQVTIELKPGPWDDDAYRNAWPIGGKIRGRANVHAPQAVKCKDITASLSWKTHGRGNTDEHSAESVTLHEGDLFDGQMLTLGFELNLPAEGPITYDGHYVNVRWNVVVRVDIPWAVDVFERAEITVLPDYDDARR